ncbi:MAG: MurR/RpiR family transcriptional regulator [Erysipelotrichaceae bacterium]|nr:MurR/RpiR family transcriptional regulator [Erysipelotrichaceae bacterium]
MDSIYNILNDYLKRTTSNSSSEVICRFMIDHLFEIPDMPLSEIAEKCYTSTPSVIRFTREIGYEGLTDLKYNIANFLDDIKDDGVRLRISIDMLDGDEEFNASLAKWLWKQNDQYYSILSSIDRKTVFKMCNDIHIHKNVYVSGIGIAGSIAEIFRIQLAVCGKIIRSINADYGSVDEGNHKENMTIFISLGGNLLKNYKNEISDYIRKKSDTNYLITANTDNEKYRVGEMIIINADNVRHEVVINALILFFELVGECYQQLYLK